MSFLETPRFPEGISYSSIGGPGYSTDVTGMSSGFESRQSNWEFGRCAYDVSQGAKSVEMMKELIAFFRVCKGRAHGFRYKDWLDYQVTQAQSTLLDLGNVDGDMTYQLAKQYTSGALSDIRKITKPVAATFKFYKDAVLQSTGFSMDATTGILTLDPDVAARNLAGGTAKTITTITRDVTTTLNVTAHGLTTGQEVLLAGILPSGLGDLLNGTRTVSSTPTANSFTVDVNTSGAPAYTGSSGTAQGYGISRTGTGLFYYPSHGLTTGQEVTVYDALPSSFSLLLGTSLLEVTVVNANFFTVGVDLSGITDPYTNTSASFAVYTSSPALTWSGDFDVPCRFDVDQMKISADSYNSMTWGNIPILEIRTA